MSAGPRVHELNVYAKSISAALHRTFQYIMDVQLATDLLEINRFAFVAECGVSVDNERSADPRQVSGQAFGDAIDEVVLLGITAEVSERQYHDGKMRG